MSHTGISDLFFRKSENRPVTSFRDRDLPVPAHLAGYSALIQAFDLPVPLHHTMAAVSPKAVRRKEEDWAIYPASSYPGERIIDNLVFALKYEGIQLLTLKKLFLVLDPAVIESEALAVPTSGYLRRISFLFEWLLGRRLDVPDVAAGAYIDLLDARQQYATRSSTNVPRFRIRFNLPGSRRFCPLVFKTRRIDAFIERRLDEQAHRILASAPPDLVARAAAFLLLSDSKASFAIEGENPPKDRIVRWSMAVSRAGRIHLDKARLLELQRLIVGDTRLIELGFREKGGFVGRHDAFGEPEPEHISARAEDLDDLLTGLLDFESGAQVADFHPVLTAACVAFGFVYIHPFEDGNGRLHRFLMHQVLAERRFTPPGVIFPISSAILAAIPSYKAVLESVSRTILPWIDWRPTSRGNVEVTQDSADYYRYFDATAHCEYLFACIERAVEKDLPGELAFLDRRDNFHRRATHVIDMSERTLDLLLRFLQQGQGRLSQRARRNEFAVLTEKETAEIEAIYGELFA